MYPGFVLTTYGKGTDVERAATERVRGTQGHVGKDQGQWMWWGMGAGGGERKIWPPNSSWFL